MKYRILEARNRRGGIEYYYIKAKAGLLSPWVSVKIQDYYWDFETLRFDSVKKAEKRIEENYPYTMVFEKVIKEIDK